MKSPPGSSNEPGVTSFTNVTVGSTLLTVTVSVSVSEARLPSLSWTVTEAVFGYVPGSV